MLVRMVVYSLYTVSHHWDVASFFGAMLCLSPRLDHMFTLWNSSPSSFLPCFHLLLVELIPLLSGSLAEPKNVEIFSYFVCMVAYKDDVAMINCFDKTDLLPKSENMKTSLGSDGSDFKFCCWDSQRKVWSSFYTLISLEACSSCFALPKNALHLSLFFFALSNTPFSSSEPLYQTIGG